jgi:hypothetical protein
MISSTCTMYDVRSTVRFCLPEGCLYLGHKQG